MKRCIVCFLLVIFSQCSQKKPAIQRSFYYWKSVFKTSAAEQNILDSLSVNKLYVKFFDIAFQNNKPQPVALVHFAQPPATEIIPTVFITNQTIENIPETEVDSLAANIIRLINDIRLVNNLNDFKEIQMDCDWSRNTKDKYFRLLSLIKQHDDVKDKVLSATIRLHQVKYSLQTGAPPVDKGLLMCYNMGNLTNPSTTNSIIDPSELAKYASHISNYMLPLDIALPVFDWFVWFRNNHYKGLVRTSAIKNTSLKDIKFEKDTIISGYSFHQHDRLRYEGSSMKDLEAAADMIGKYLGLKNFNVVLFHLDEEQLEKYSIHELENIFNRFH